MQTLTTSQNGNLALAAGNKATIAGSDVGAGQDLTVIAKDIDLLARQIGRASCRERV